MVTGGATSGALPELARALPGIVPEAALIEVWGAASAGDAGQTIDAVAAAAGELAEGGMDVIRGLAAGAPDGASSGDGVAEPNPEPGCTVTPVEPIDLPAHEDVGGHTIQRHVNQSDEALAARAADESLPVASTFPDLEVAERAVGSALLCLDRELRTWFFDASERRLVCTVAFALPVGRVLYRGASLAGPSDTIRLVLDPPSRVQVPLPAELPFRITTAFPIDGDHTTGCHT